jgi:hypothetical protein
VTHFTVNPILSQREADLKHACLESASDSVPKNVQLELTYRLDRRSRHDCEDLRLGQAGTCAMQASQGGEHTMTIGAGTAAFAHTADPATEGAETMDRTVNAHGRPLMLRRTPTNYGGENA